MPWLDLGPPVGCVHYRGAAVLDPATEAALTTMLRRAYDQALQETTRMDPLDPPRPIRALTLTQPWATLVALGAKQIETRSWGTSYRGPLAIHAAKGLSGFSSPVYFYRLCSTEPFAAALRAAGYGLEPPYAAQLTIDADALPRGAVIAVCRLVDCERIGPACSAVPDHRTPERAFGDYQPGRYMWLLADVQRLPTPIPARGSLGLWNWTPPPALMLEQVQG